ncbi:hypothetical protein CRG98_034558 [Punica granatum]|uniref:Reverse transcriptase Ty1/copia-type domain-containing protein n=1 Tax=Punica granatum TaxID=22663 RepID=A0A2I0IM21_PUNGR|nr:hypothetical protein CRG98_034558 [Punica granatum]
MSTMKFNSEKFDSNYNFGGWQARMLAILVQNGLKKVLLGTKPESMSASDWEELDEKVLSTIQFCLTNTILWEVLYEKKAVGLWAKLETLYMTKSLANRLVLKQRLYTFHMAEGTSAACKTIGISTVWIGMHDGVIRTLTDVRHVLDLKKNLVSLGILDSNGCKIIIESNCMKISYGNHVLMKGMKVELETGASSSQRKAPDSDKWLMAMEEEMEFLHKNGTWELVKPHIGKRIVSYKWIFKKKKGSDSEYIGYKACLVAKGYRQVEGVDFHDMFSLVVKHTSIRALLALVAIHNLELEQLAMKTTFLHGDLNEDIYLQRPEGFEVEGKGDRIC